MAILYYKYPINLPNVCHPLLFLCPVFLPQLNSSKIDAAFFPPSFCLGAKRRIAVVFNTTVPPTAVKKNFREKSACFCQMSGTGVIFLRN